MQGWPDADLLPTGIMAIGGAKWRCGLDEWVFSGVEASDKALENARDGIMMMMTTPCNDDYG